MTTEFRSVAGGQPDADTDQPDAELRMRRALGLRPSGKEVVQRRADGGPIIAERGVPDRGPRNFEPMVNRVAQAETALANERRAREQAERGLRDAQAALHESETRRGHAEMARDEALATLAAERSARAAAEAARQAAEAERDAAQDALSVVEEQVNQTVAAAKSVPIPPLDATQDEPPAPAPKKRGRPAKVQAPAPVADESAPVEWWVPGWRSRV